MIAEKREISFPFFSHNANCHALPVGLPYHLRGSTLYPSLAAVTADTAPTSQPQTLLTAS